MSDLRKILAAATPGPWEADGAPWNRIVCSATNRVCFVAHSDGLNDERDIATSELVALAPSLAAALLKAEEALAFYADPNIYCSHPHGLAFEDRDKSYVARAALAEIKALTGG